MPILTLLFASAFALAGGLGTHAGQHSPAQVQGRCADAGAVAQSITVSRADSLDDVAAPLPSGVQATAGYRVESNAGCALTPNFYNIMANALALAPNVIVRFQDAANGSLAVSVETGALEPLPSSWSSPAMNAPPSIRGYRFASAVRVPEYEDAYVGIWHREGSVGAPSIAALFRSRADGGFDEPRVLIRSEHVLRGVYAGPSFHGDGRKLAIVQSLPSGAVAVATFDWYSGRFLG